MNTHKKACQEFKAVIFDLDGTLLDTLRDIADSMNSALESMGYPPHDVDAYKHLTGEGVAQMAERSLPPAARDDAAIEDCIRRFRSAYVENYMNHSRPYEGIPELLDILAGRKISLNILSNKLDDFTKLLARNLLSRWPFSHVLGSGAGFPRKPDPSGALLIARELNIRPAEFIYAGDTATDMLTAAAAGMHAVGVLWGFREEAELREGGAAEVIQSPSELLAHFMT